jgi:hypothetical protein
MMDGHRLNGAIVFLTSSPAGQNRPDVDAGAVVGAAPTILRAAKGEYFVHAQLIGYNGGTLPIHIRSGVRDSIFLELHQKALCD